MEPQGIVFLGVVIATFSLFGGVLGWASWQETRERKAKERAGA